MTIASTARRNRPGTAPSGGSAVRAGRPRRWDREQTLTAFVFLAPAAVVLGVFVLYPIIDAGYVSLTSWNGFAPTKPFVGLANYLRLAHDPEFWNSLAVTLAYAAGVCVLSVVTGLAIAPDPTRLVIGVGAGAAKLPALRAAMLGGLVSGLVTDEPTAAALLGDPASGLTRAEQF